VILNKTKIEYFISVSIRSPIFPSLIFSVFNVIFLLVSYDIHSCLYLSNCSICTVCYDTDMSDILKCI
jgi:hypothetical protein